MADVVLTWERCETFRRARGAFRQRPCIYVLVAEDEQQLLYVGESGDLWNRYRGGTGSMVDAALSGSNKITYAAEAPSDERERKVIEGSLTYKHKPAHCVHNKWVEPARVVEVEHRGNAPKRFLA